MGKIVILSFLSGDCHQGFPAVRLEIREDDQRLLMNIMGSLPAMPKLPEIYTEWQSKYRQMGLRFRLDAPPGQVTNFSDLEIEDMGNLLKQDLNNWLCDQGFIPIRDRLFGLNRNEFIRFIVETENFQLRLLPWHLWEFFEQYLYAEVALSLTKNQVICESKYYRDKTRILAIIGDSTGINLDIDRQQIKESLGQTAEITFLQEPDHDEVNQMLWDPKGWDILFFAGHSLSEPQGTTGKLFINRSKDSLEIDRLKATIRRVISRGLKLAIFNSCDGLGIAKKLADLNIPQVIVMREPVPDVVAQKFLKYFLEAFSRSEPLYLAVREAREKLESIEHEFSCASWLPVLCQNLAEEPISWQKLCQTQSQNILSSIICPDCTHSNPTNLIFCEQCGLQLVK